MRFSFISRQWPPESTATLFLIQQQFLCICCVEQTFLMQCHFTLPKWHTVRLRIQVSHTLIHVCH